MKIIDITNENFEKEVLKSDKKVLVDFNAKWCGPCRMLKPILDEVSEELDDVKIVSVNVDDCSDLVRMYGIMSIPCLILIKNGAEVKRSIGLISRDEIIRFIGD